MAKYRVDFIRHYQSNGKEVTVTVVKDSTESKFTVKGIEGRDLSKITANFSATFRQYLTKGASEGDVTYWALKPDMVTEPANALAALKIPMVAEDDIKDIIKTILEQLKGKGFSVDQTTIINYVTENNITNITDVRVEGDVVIINGKSTPIRVTSKTKREGWRWSDFCAKATEEEKKEYYRTHFPKGKRLSGESLSWALQNYYHDATNLELLVKFMKDNSIVLEALEEAE